jgi:hypothetical protein
MNPRLNGQSINRKFGFLKLVMALGGRRLRYHKNGE